LFSNGFFFVYILHIYWFAFVKLLIGTSFKRFVHIAHT